jgi:hypothetical protein
MSNRRREIKWPRAIAIGACILWGATCPADAQSCPTSLVTKATGWNNLSFNDCMRRGESALREEGFEAARSEQAAGGTRGRYSAQIVCAQKQVVVFVVVGPESNEAQGYVTSLFNAFSQKR